MNPDAPPVHGAEPPSPASIRILLPTKRRFSARLWWPLWRVRWILALLVAYRSLPYVVDWVERHAPAGSWDYTRLPQAVFTIERILRVPVDRPHTLCLPRSLLLYYTLLRTGVPVKMNIGLDTSSEAHSHAWVTVEGQPVWDGQNQAGLFPLFLHSSGALNYWVNAPSPPTKSP